MIMTEERLKKVKDYANHQFCEYDGTQIGFVNDEGIEIINPWMDNEGENELTDEEAIKMYGLVNVVNFINEVWKHIN